MQARYSPADASLSIDCLRSFMAVVECGSQSKAAKQLRISQPTVGRHVERVQEHFGGGLFESGASGRLSPRGTLVEQTIRNVLGALVDTRERLSDGVQVLRVGYMRLMRPLVEQTLRGVLRQSATPALDVRLHELRSEEQQRALLRRELDIAICYELPALDRTDLERARISVATEVIAYAAAGTAYGFLPALWSTAGSAGVAFAPVAELAACTTTISAYSLRHAARGVAHFREALIDAARAASRGFRFSGTRPLATS